jgi:hypothetical protein
LPRAMCWRPLIAGLGTTNEARTPRRSEHQLCAALSWLNQLTRFSSR